MASWTSRRPARSRSLPPSMRWGESLLSACLASTVSISSHRGHAKGSPHPPTTSVPSRPHRLYERAHAYRISCTVCHGVVRVVVRAAIACGWIVCVGVGAVTSRMIWKLHGSCAKQASHAYSTRTHPTSTTPPVPRLKEDLIRGIYAYGFERPSAIQQRAILPILKGRDVIAQSVPPALPLSLTATHICISLSPSSGPCLLRILTLSRFRPCYCSSCVCAFSPIEISALARHRASWCSCIWAAVYRICVLVWTPVQPWPLTDAW